MELNAQVQTAEARSRELATQLDAAERQLEQLRGEYAHAVKDLDQRLVAIYESDAPDYVTVLLNSDGFDDLSTRSDYLNALHEADIRIADKVASLRDQVAGDVHRVADLKQQSDQEAQQLAVGQAELRGERAGRQPERRGGRGGAIGNAGLALRRPGSGGAAREEQAGRAAVLIGSSGSGSPAYLGGPYSIPTYIVMCESGGNYHALNSSSGAGGAYQILPSTWAAYGGQGAPQDAPKAEQDRIAAEIWRDSGPSAWSCA